MDRKTIGGLSVARVLHDFVVEEALPGTGIAPEAFWSGLSAILRDLAPRNRALLETRDAIRPGSTPITASGPASRWTRRPTRPS